MQQVTISTIIRNDNSNFKVGPTSLDFLGRPISTETFATWLIRL